MLELVIVVLVVLAVVAPAIEAAAISAGADRLFGLAIALFRRFNGDYKLVVTGASDGLHLRSGLVETSAETIPMGRIQAIRMIEPLAWRASAGADWRSTSPARSPGGARIAISPKPRERYCQWAAETRPRSC